MIGLDIKQRIEVEFLAICVYLAGHSPFIPLSLASRFIGNTFDSLNLKMSQPGSCRGISPLVFGYWLYSNCIIILKKKGFGPPIDFNMSSSAWGAYRALGQTNLPMNWSSLTGVNVNPLLHPTVWDSLNPHRSIAPGNKLNELNYM